MSQLRVSDSAGLDPIEIEADPRHVEILANVFGQHGQRIRTLSSPGVKPKEIDSSTHLSAGDVTTYRSGVMRAAFLERGSVGHAARHQRVGEGHGHAHGAVDVAIEVSCSLSHRPAPRRAEHGAPISPKHRCRRIGQRSRRLSQDAPLDVVFGFAPRKPLYQGHVDHAASDRLVFRRERVLCLGQSSVPIAWTQAYMFGLWQTGPL